jgi:uncharacterized membrane protein
VFLEELFTGALLIGVALHIAGGLAMNIYLSLVGYIVVYVSVQHFYEKLLKSQIYNKGHNSYFFQHRL